MHPKLHSNIPYPDTPECLLQRDLSEQDLSDTGSSLSLVYRWMFLARRTDDRLRDLFRQGKVAGTLAGGQGNEGLVVPLTLLINKELDVLSLSHRGLGGHLIWSDHLCDHLCQYMANSGSPTLGREGNVHHGDPAKRSLPFISHLGAMVSNLLGSTDSQRRDGKQAVGISFIGDGTSSTGDIHEAMNFATLFKLPVVFIIENNEYAYSTPVKEQYGDTPLVKRAEGYGMEGITLDVSDTEELLTQFDSIISDVRSSSKPVVVEVKTLRLQGHAAYDTCDYLDQETIDGWNARDPLPILRERVIGDLGEEAVSGFESEINAWLEKCIEVSISQPPLPEQELEADQFSNEFLDTEWSRDGEVFENQTFAQALNLAHKLILEDSDRSIIMGQDIALYGGAFKVTDELFSQFGRTRVLNSPLAESCEVGYCTGLALNGHRPILEFQFSDFSTEAITQICMNAGTYFFRSGAKVPLVLRFPTGGGLTFGTFHSQELESIFLHFPGLKVLYPSTVQDAFDCLLAAYDSEDPVLLFEHKGLYRGVKGDVEVHADYHRVWEPRHVRSGETATLVTYGEMVHTCTESAAYLEDEYEYSLDVFDLRALKPWKLDSIRESLKRTGRLIVANEARRTAGFGAEIISTLLEDHFFDMEAAPLRISSLDAPVPFAPPLEKQYRPSVDKISQQIIHWMESNS